MRFFLLKIIYISTWIAETTNNNIFIIYTSTSIFIISLSKKLGNTFFVLKLTYVKTSTNFTYTCCILIIFGTSSIHTIRILIFASKSYFIIFICIIIISIFIILVYIIIARISIIPIYIIVASTSPICLIYITNTSIIFIIYLNIFIFIISPSKKLVYAFFASKSNS